MVQTFRQWLSGSTIRTYHSQTTYRRTDDGLVRRAGSPGCRASP
ncbi:hypothetical protein STANM309S_06575 [Streptomyces tanashiensis]